MDYKKLIIELLDEITDNTLLRYIYMILKKSVGEE